MDANAFNGYTEDLRFFVAPKRSPYYFSMANDFAAILMYPYTESTMTFMEDYNMNIPMFLPSFKLAYYQESHKLQKWLMHPVFDASRSTATYAHRAPDWQEDVQALREQFLEIDYYNGEYPHMIYWDSVPHMISQLVERSPENLTAVSKEMAHHNAK